MSFEIKCWVNHCNSSSTNSNLKFFPLPKAPKFKETWLALTGKKLVIPEEHVYYCERHFRKSSFEEVSGELVFKALPYFEMPAMICRMCRSTIPNTAFFCVVSATIPSPVPPELMSNLVSCRAEPLYQILTFCIPNLSIEQNPPSLVCIKCYFNIWQYFVFKLQCNTIENKVRGNLSPEEYGRLVLCRSCPETCSTKFFTLNESQPMGQVFKGLFLNNFPEHIVPLKLCLMCYNVLNKITEFHKQAVLSDQMTRRCEELNHSQITISSFRGNGSEVKPIGPIKIVQCYQGDASTSDSTSNSNHSTTSNPEREQLNAVRIPVINWKQQEAGIIELDPEMPWLSPQGDVPLKKEPSFSKVDPQNETKVEMNRPLSFIPQNNVVLDTGPKPSELVSQREVVLVTKCESNKLRNVKPTFSQDAKVYLAQSVLKHFRPFGPGVDHLEQASIELKMWLNVVKDLHDWGFRSTLENIQSTWTKMKRAARSARNSIGPMSYIDFLVDTYIHVSSTPGSSQAPSKSNYAQDAANKHNFKTDTAVIDKETAILGRLLGQSKKSISRDNSIGKYSTPQTSQAAINDCDIICIDDDDDDDVICENSSSAAKGDPKNYYPGRDVLSAKSRTKHNLRNSVDNKVPPQPAKLLVRPPNNAGETTSSAVPIRKNPKDKLSRRCLGQSWSVKQKLELIQEMREEFNRLKERNELGSSKVAPWKKILNILASRGFRNMDIHKLYSRWSSMKTSAMIYEKNGNDVVDNEVWDLIQLYEVEKAIASSQQNDLVKKRGTDEEESSLSNDWIPDEESARRERDQPPPSKVRKLSNPTSPTICISNETYVTLADIEMQTGSLVDKVKTKSKPKTRTFTPSDNTYISLEDLEKGLIFPMEETSEESDTESASTDPQSDLEKKVIPARENRVQANSKIKTGNKKRNNFYSDKEKYEVVLLIEKELKRILATRGSFNESFGSIVRRLKYKNWSCGTMRYIWQSASRVMPGATPTQLQKKMQQLLQMHKNNLAHVKATEKTNVGGDKGKNKAASSPSRGNVLPLPRGRLRSEKQTAKTASRPPQENSSPRSRGRPNSEKQTVKASSDPAEENSSPRPRGRPREEKQATKTAGGSTQENSAPRPRGRPKMTHNKKSLDLVAIIRSFGNEVFKKMDHVSRKEFWSRVEAKYRAKGHREKTNLAGKWAIMLSSAKQTWAQDGRKPQVGDQEIIDFMTEVIMEKERAKNDPKSDVSAEEGEMSTQEAEDIEEVLDSDEEVDKTSSKNSEDDSLKMRQNEEARAEQNVEECEMVEKEEDIEEVPNSDKEISNDEHDSEDVRQASKSTEEDLDMKQNEQNPDEQSVEPEAVEKEVEYIEESEVAKINETLPLNDEKILEGMKRKLRNIEQQFLKMKQNKQSKPEQGTEEDETVKEIEFAEELSELVSKIDETSSKHDEKTLDGVNPESKSIEEYENVQDKTEEESTEDLVAQENTPVEKESERMEEVSENDEEVSKIYEQTEHAEEVSENDEEVSKINENAVQNDEETSESIKHNSQIIKKEFNIDRETNKLAHSEGSDSNDGGYYDYVSLDDLKRQSGSECLERPKPTVTGEIIEILDSDEE